jgi:hypothetical protein
VPRVTRAACTARRCSCAARTSRPPDPALAADHPDAARALFGVASLDGSPSAGRSRRPGTSRSSTRRALPVAQRDRHAPGQRSRAARQYVAIGAHNDHIGLTRASSITTPCWRSIRSCAGRARRTRFAGHAAEAARIAALRDSLTRAHGGARRDSVNNGADDDGSGTVAMLEIAEAFARSGRARALAAVRLAHRRGEGLWGSQWFTDHPTVPRDSIVAQLNMDMVGRGKPTDAMGRGPNNIQLIGVRGSPRSSAT